MTDTIFLLSEEEFHKYEKWLPPIDIWWWLRSPGRNQNYAASVSTDGSLGYHSYVNYDSGSVRPALRIGNLKSSNLKIGKRVVLYDFPWIVIDVEEPLAIAEVPIGFHRFDKDSNDYETSEVRKFCLDWLKARN